MKYFKIALLFFSLIIFSGCGQTGKLYLPKQDQVKATPQQTQVVQHDAKKG